MLCGSALIATQVTLNVEHLGQVNAFSGLGLAAIVVPISMAIAVPAMEHCWNERRYAAACVALIVILCGVSHTMVVALERGAHGRDVTAAAKSNHGYELAKMAHTNATARVAELEGRLTQERKTGCGPRCRALQASLSDARARADETQAKLAQIGAPVDEDSMAKRYGTVAHLIDLWHPLLLPLALELGGLMLVGFALHRGGAQPQRRSAAVVPLPQSKHDEAIKQVRSLADKLGRKPTLHEVVTETELPRTTAWRALKSAA
ncbi:MAG: hypothetical protein AAFQ90_09540 [Pseudomonadota bacterium]